MKVNIQMPWEKLENEEEWGIGGIAFIFIAHTEM